MAGIQSSGVTRRKIKKFDVVYVQDFGDDYHKPKTNEDTLAMQVRSITSQYYDVMLYNEHKEIYEEYMESLYVKYGGKDVFDIYRNEGMLDDFIPNKPRLKKNNIAVEDYQNYGILNSHITDKYNSMQWKTIIERAKELAHENLMYDAEMRGDYSMDDIDMHTDIVYNELKGPNEFKAVTMCLGESAVKSKTKSQYSKVGYELFEDFYNSSRRGNAEEFELDKAIKYPSITAALSDNYDPDDYFSSPSEKEGSKYNYIGVNGKMLSDTQYNDYQFYESLDKLGWDSDKIKRRFNQDSLSNDSSIDNMFNKTKKKKKKKKQKQIVRAAEDLLTEIGNASNADCSYSNFEEYENAMLDCTSFGVYDKY